MIEKLYSIAVIIIASMLILERISGWNIWYKINPFRNRRIINNHSESIDDLQMSKFEIKDDIKKLQKEVKQLKTKK